MPRSLLQRLAPWALAAVCLNADAAAADGFLRGCAARDLQVMMLIEERASAGTVPTERVRDAVLGLMHARMVCHEGHVVDALSLYESIAQSLAPDQLEPRPPGMT